MQHDAANTSSSFRDAVALLQSNTSSFDRLHARVTGIDDTTLTAPWKITVPAGEVRLFIVLAGECRYVAERLSIALAADDALVMGAELNGTLCEEDASDNPSNSASPSHGRVTRLLSVGFESCDAGFGLPTRYEPAIFRFDGKSPVFRPWIKELVRLLIVAPSTERADRAAIINRLLSILLIEAITSGQREGHAEPAANSNSTDAEIRAVLLRMHQQPEFPWTVARLADSVGLSRSTFAARFAAIVGMPPLHYLRDVRMRRAVTLLVGHGCGLKEISRRVGYKTFSAFSNAFKRWAGTSPGEYRRSHTQSAAIDSRL